MQDDIGKAERTEAINTGGDYEAEHDGAVTTPGNYLPGLAAAAHTTTPPLLVSNEPNPADLPSDSINHDRPAPRFEFINRQQMIMKAIDVEQLVSSNHPVRAIWEFVGRLDLTSFCQNIKAVEGERGRPCYDPRLMISLWVYAYSRGVNSAREVSRLCDYDPAFQWLTGMNKVNYHSLSDFRVDHDQAVKDLFIGTIGVLTWEGLVDLARVMHDGTKIKSATGSSTLRTEKSIKEHLETTRKYVEELEAHNEEEEDDRRTTKARKRAAREKQQRLEAALEEFKKIVAQQSDRKEKKKEEDIRVSKVEPEARKMKHNDGGFAPSYNLQISVESSNGIIVGSGLSQAPVDYDELHPAVDRVKENTGELPAQVVTDGGYTSGNNIDGMAQRGIDFIAPVTDSLIQLKYKGIDEAFSRDAFVYNEQTNSYTCPAAKVLNYKGKERRGKGWRLRYRASAADCASCPFKQQCCPGSKHGRSVMRGKHDLAVANHKVKMETDEAKQIYRQRGQWAEFPNMWIKEKLRLRRFRVRGLIKAGLEAIWACITYNIQQWIRLRWIEMKT